MKTKPATKAERRRMRLIKEIGCVVCGSSPCEVHHLLSGGVRRGHMFTIGLCTDHHTGSGDMYAPSYHGSKKQFQAICGYDAELLARQDDLIKEHSEWYQANTVGGAR